MPARHAQIRRSQRSAREAKVTGQERAVAADRQQGVKHIVRSDDVGETDDVRQ